MSTFFVVVIGGLILLYFGYKIGKQDGVFQEREARIFGKILEMAKQDKSIPKKDRDSLNDPKKYSIKRLNKKDISKLNAEDITKVVKVKLDD